MNNIMTMTDEKVQLKNVIRHLKTLKKEYPKGTYDVACKMLWDSLTKLSDKLAHIQRTTEVSKDILFSDQAMSSTLDFRSGYYAASQISLRDSAIEQRNDLLAISEQGHADDQSYPE